MKDKDRQEQLDRIEKKLDMLVEHLNIDEKPVRSPVDIQLQARRDIETWRAKREKREQRKLRENKTCQEKKK